MYKINVKCESCGLHTQIYVTSSQSEGDCPECGAGVPLSAYSEDEESGDEYGSWWHPYPDNAEEIAKQIADEIKKEKSA